MASREFEKRDLGDIVLDAVKYPATGNEHERAVWNARVATIALGLVFLVTAGGFVVLVVK